MNRKGLLAVGVIVALAAGYYIFLVPDGGSSTEQLATKPEGTAIVNVEIPAELSGTAKIGEMAFNAKCVVCHGANGEGRKGVAPPLVHKIYEPNHHGDTAFFRATQNGVRSHHWPFGDMPPVEGLTRADVSNIVAYIRELQRENGIN